jgi:hypothetical protein
MLAIQRPYTDPSVAPVLAPGSGESKDNPGLAGLAGRFDDTLSYEALLGGVIILATLAGMNNDNDLRKQIENGNEAGRRAADEAEKASKWRFYSGLAGAGVATVAAAYAIKSAMQAAPAAKNEIAANLKVKDAMASEKMAGDQARASVQQAEQSRAKAKALQESQAANLEKASTDGQGAQDALEKSSAEIKTHLDAAEKADAEALEAQGKERNHAHDRTMATMDSSTASAQRNQHLENSRTGSTVANAANAAASTGGAFGGLYDAEKVRADADKNEADARNGLSSSAKQGMLGQANDMIGNQKVMNNAAVQALQSQMRF